MHEYVNINGRDSQYKECVDCNKRTPHICFRCNYCYSCHFKIESIEKEHWNKRNGNHLGIRWINQTERYLIRCFHSLTCIIQHPLTPRNPSAYSRFLCLSYSTTISGFGKYLKKTIERNSRYRESRAYSSCRR